jgi:DNA polymerase
VSTLSDDINDFCFLDTETKALPFTAGTPDESVVTAGAYRYSKCAVVNVIQWAIGDDPVEVSAFKDFRDPTRRFIWQEPFLPPKLWAFHQRVLKGEAWYVPWNAAFDRLLMNASVKGFVVPPSGFIDGMVQAVASNLPAKLEGASRAIGRSGKHEGGKNYIRLFTSGEWGETYDAKGGLLTATPESHPQEWHDFTRGYGAQDVDELRAVFKATRPLPRKEWEEYWVSEKINDRGIAVDVDFADRAAAMAELNGRHLNARMTRLTGGAIAKVTQRERIANWLYDRTPHAEARDTLVKAWTSDDEVTGEDDELVPSKLSIAEDRLNAWRNFYEVLDENEGLTDEEFELVEIAEARATGASATPAKFQKIVDQHDEGRLKGQYVFNGAPQTGRFSSRGVQVHNLIRASLTDKAHPDRELDAIELINTLELSYE